MTSKFKVGDRVVLEGVIETVDDDHLPYHVRFRDGSAEWYAEDAHITLAPERVACGPEQLEAVTKERDDAREQLARVCAQVETLGAARKADQAEYAGDVARLTALLGKRTKDARILDCVATLLAMRGES